MPELSRFFGIIIRMYLSDHTPPHFHAFYQDYEAMFDIAEGNLLQGALPRKETRLVLAWLEVHREELFENWKIATQRRGELNAIKPLD
ncbi:MAG: DUF4160 domain-containing protein [Alphaproteobacteria bacterium]|nr:DUF4160 domain-containing protein [Alphaproteobacteria bacterium]